jgi:hypothetical protein
MKTKHSYTLPLPPSSSHTTFHSITISCLPTLCHFNPSPLPGHPPFHLVALQWSLLRLSTLLCTRLVRSTNFGTYPYSCTWFMSNLQVINAQICAHTKHGCTLTANSQNFDQLSVFSLPNTIARMTGDICPFAVVP